MYLYLYVDYIVNTSLSEESKYLIIEYNWFVFITRLIVECALKKYIRIVSSYESI